jgi:hypothetical protein
MKENKPRIFIQMAVGILVFLSGVIMAGYMANPQWKSAIVQTGIWIIRFGILLFRG